MAVRLAPAAAPTVQVAPAVTAGTAAATAAPPAVTAGAVAATVAAATEAEAEATVQWVGRGAPGAAPVADQQRVHVCCEYPCATSSALAGFTPELECGAAIVCLETKLVCLLFLFVTLVLSCLDELFDGVQQASQSGAGPGERARYQLRVPRPRRPPQQPRP